MPTLGANPPAVAGTLTAAGVFAGASDMDVAMAALAGTASAVHLTSSIESIPVFGGTGHAEPPELGFAGRPSDWFFV